VLDIQVKIGSKNFRPTSNNFLAKGVDVGEQGFQIQGRIFCSVTNAGCVASGAGTIDVRPGGNYAVSWFNPAFAQCTVQLTEQ